MTPPFAALAARADDSQLQLETCSDGDVHRSTSSTVQLATSVSAGPHALRPHAQRLVSPPLPRQQCPPDGAVQTATCAVPSSLTGSPQSHRVLVTITHVFA